MRWQQGQRSRNVEDRRGRGAGKLLVGGGGIVSLIALAAAVLFGVDPSAITGGGEGSPAPRPEAENELADFASVVLADTEQVWHRQLAERGGAYQEPTLVLFTDAVSSACGTGTAAVGPFYCPRDQQIYLDLSFFGELERRHDAPGDFARAYVIAHEVGHHVQTLLGVSDAVQRQRQVSGEREGNQLSVRQELQADCFAGVWAHHADRQRDVLEPGDIEEALGAAAAIGDDTLQRRNQGTVMPDSFTHGSAEQRATWFRRGFEQGSLESCDTFEIARL